MKIIFRTTLTIVAMWSLALSPSALAKTPDGETPAEETWCDPLKNKGVTPGLYGLCVAYCEAHDAELLDELNTPNRRILANYSKKKKPSDPDMPCLLESGGEQPEDACPCWSAQQLEQLIPPQDAYDASNPYACWNDPNIVMIENFEAGEQGPGYQLWVSVIPYEEGCVTERVNYPGGPPSGANYSLTPEQGASCAALLTDYARSQSGPGDLWNCFD